MIKIGTNIIGPYTLWIEKSFDSTHYYEVLLTRKEVFSYNEKTYNIVTYVNLIKSELRFLFDLNDRNYPKPNTDLNQYKEFLSRKQMSQPLWYLSEESVGQLIAWCKVQI